MLNQSPIPIDRIIAKSLKLNNPISMEITSDDFDTSYNSIDKFQLKRIEICLTVLIHLNVISLQLHV